MMAVSMLFRINQNEYVELVDADGQLHAESGIITHPARTSTESYGTGCREEPGRSLPATS